MDNTSSIPSLVPRFLNISGALSKNDLILSELHPSLKLNDNHDDNQGKNSSRSSPNIKVFDKGINLIFCLFKQRLEDTQEPF